MAPAGPPGKHAIIAGIALHEGKGFEEVAHFKETGCKHGRWIDGGYWELLLR